MDKMKIMLVDDEERFLATTSKLLNKKGYDVFTATNGFDALDKIKEHLIHVVVLDVKMPGMNGNDVLREIKRLHPLVEVIMLTGHATIESAVDGLKTGACDYMSKPADIDELIAKAESAFARRQDLEEKIHSARMRKFRKSPRSIIKNAE